MSELDAREEMLRRIRTALADRPAPPEVPRDYRGAGQLPADVGLFVERVTDYRAEVVRCGDDAAEVRRAITARLRSRGHTRVVVPAGFPSGWRPDVELVAEPVSTDQLDRVDAVLTTCRLAVAETGTIVLDAGPGMGPRSLSLVPDHHVVVVRASQVVAGVPDAVAALDPTLPLTWISGPSATSDIELDRVEGVHGPRVFDVVLVSDHPSR